MLTFDKLINELSSIHEAANTLEIKGNQNAAIVCYICGKCEDLVKELQVVAADAQTQENQNESKTNMETDSNPEIIMTEVGEEIGN